MKSLLLIAHGSRRAESNEEIKELADKLRALSGSEFNQVECAFLELADPSIEHAIDAMVATGETHILCVPYFLARGAHVASDIPEAINAAKAKHTDVVFAVSEYLGEAEQMPDILMQLAGRASTREEPSRT